MGKLVCLIAIGALSIVSVLQAQKTADEPPSSKIPQADVKTEIQQLEREIEALRKSPDAPDAWKQVVELQARLNQLSVDRNNNENEVRRKIIELGQTDDYQAWENRIKSLSDRLNALYQERFARDKGINREVFAARHGELTKLAIAQTPELRALGLDLLSYPRMDGSTSTQPLAALIACRCFSMPYAWVGRDNRPARPWSPGLAWDEVEWQRRFVPAEPEYDLLEYMLRATGDDRLAEIINRLLVVNASTHDAYVRIIEGKSDLGLLARGPSAAELETARQKGVELDIVPCALDAFVFLVHRDNPVRGLTSDQIRRIYTGPVSNWRALGGLDEAITPFRREDESGSEELMRTLVMTGLPFGSSERHPYHLAGSGMGGVFLSLTNNRKGIGYSVYYYERYMSGSPQTRVIAVDGVEPTYETIRDRKYPYTCEVFIVKRKGEPNAPARKLRDWLRSPEGQAVVRESGYVPSTAVER